MKFLLISRSRKIILKQLLVIVVNLAFVLFMNNTGIADENNEQNEVLHLRQEGKILPLETILGKVNTIHSGKILEAELENEHGRYIYEIEILTDNGTVLELKYDALSAILLSTEKED